jgi:hypothetical protein
MRRTQPSTATLSKRRANRGLGSAALEQSTAPATNKTGGIIQISETIVRKVATCRAKQIAAAPTHSANPSVFSARRISYLSVSAHRHCTEPTAQLTKPKRLRSTRMLVAGTGIRIEAARMPHVCSCNLGCHREQAGGNFRWSWHHPSQSKRSLGWATLLLSCCTPTLPTLVPCIFRRGWCFIGSSRSCRYCAFQPALRRRIGTYSISS